MARSIETTYRAFSASKADARQLALEIRSRRFAFAVVQGQTLLDWGMRKVACGSPGKKLGINSLVLLLDWYAPSVVVARRTREARGESKELAARIFRRIRGEAKRRSVPFIPLDRNHRRNVFVQLGCRNKHDIAMAVADRFEEMKRRLPPPRKLWDRERKRVAVFDAVATAMAFNALRDDGKM